MRAILGKCSLCGGLVEVETVSWSVVAPEPRCNTCGANPLKSELPTIPMKGTANNAGNKYMKYYGWDAGRAKQEFLNDNKTLPQARYINDVREFFQFVNDHPEIFVDRPRPSVQLPAISEVTMCVN